MRVLKTISWILIAAGLFFAIYGLISDAVVERYTLAFMPLGIASSVLYITLRQKARTEEAPQK